MGNNHASGSDHSFQAAVRGRSSTHCKVILSDGTVQQFHEPLTVAELMLEHPQQVVVEFNSVSTKNFTSTKRPAPLPADQVLDKKTVYMMVPVRGGRPLQPLSTNQAQQILNKANSMLRTNCNTSLLFTGIIPFIAGRMLCSSGIKGGTGGCMIMDHKTDTRSAGRRMEDTEFSKVEFSMEDRPEYLIRRELSGKGWKPSLDTIKEKVAEQKGTHWPYHRQLDMNSL